MLKLNSYQAMADLKLSQKTFQYDEAAGSHSKCCKTYVARQLFRRLAREDRLAEKNRDTEESHDHAAQPKEVFKLWSDDLQFSSVLVDDNNDLVGVVDWEWTYFAPASFYPNAPWWLILRKPVLFGKKDLSSWSQDFERRLPLFLEAMEMGKAALEESESSALRSKSVDLVAIHEVDRKEARSLLAPIFSRAQQNWDNGKFWVDFVVRNGYHFDRVYWDCIDERFFGPRNVRFPFRSKKSEFKARLHLLSRRELAQMERFVAWKLKAEEDDQDGTGENCKIVEWEGHDAQIIWAACLDGALGKIEIPQPRVIPYTPRTRDDKVEPAGPS